MSQRGMGAEHEIFRRQIHFTFKLECVQFNKCHESCLFPAVMHKEICEKDFEGFPQIADASAELLFLCACVCVCTWSTDGGLDPSLLQIRNSVYGALDMLHEYIPVQVKQAEGKLIRHLRNKPNTNTWKMRSMISLKIACCVFKKGQYVRVAHLSNSYSKQIRSSILCHQSNC